MPSSTVALQQEQVDLLISLYNSGEFVHSENEAKKLLTLFPDSTIIINILGSILTAQEKLEEAIATFDQAISLNPHDAWAYNDKCVALKKLGQFEAAIDSCKQAIRLEPDYAEAHNNLGLIFQDIGNFNEALNYYSQAILYNPNYFEAYNNKATVLRNLGKITESLENSNQAININPNYANAYNTRGIALQTLGKSEEALKDYIQCIQLNPNDALAFYNIAFAFQQLGKYDEAEINCQQAINLNPNFAEAYNTLGIIYKDLNQYSKAIINYQKAIEIDPSFAFAYVNLGIIFHEQYRYDDAINCFNKAIEIRPSTEALNSYASTLNEIRHYEESISLCEQSLKLDPNKAETYNTLGRSLREMGKPDEAFINFKKSIQLFPSSALLHNSLCFSSNYLPQITQQETFNHHINFGQQFDALDIETKTFKSRTENKRLRIAYVSGDFRNHPVSSFFNPLLSLHDKSKVEIYCYYNHHINDKTTAQLEKISEHWQNILGLTDEQVFQLIKQDNIDILVDLSGHTGGNRLLVFAKKPAPVQVTWLGYVTTTGLKAMDYRFTDEIADPTGTTDKYYTEKLYRLDSGFICYQGDYSLPKPSSLPLMHNEFITFGCFNNLAKITRETISLWSTILHAIPNSHLIIKSIQLDSKDSKELVWSHFNSDGISSKRIDLYGFLPTKEEHYALYGKIDIALDPFPYNGTTTTCEALWMGVPIITLLGDRHVSRVGASILSHIELPEFITTSTDEYKQLAIDLSQDKQYLSQLRLELRDKVNQSDLGNTQLFTDNVEAAYKKMYQNFIDS